MFFVHQVNSISKLHEAIVYGYTNIEVDLCYKNDTIMLSHDNYVWNTTDISLCEFLKYMTDTFKNTFTILLDIKSNFIHEHDNHIFVKNLNDILYYYPHHHFKISSFNEFFLQSCLNQSIKYELGLITSGITFDYLQKYKQYQFISINENMITPELVYLCHSNLLDVYSWTIKQPGTIYLLSQMNVDHIIFDLKNV